MFQPTQLKISVNNPASGQSGKAKGGSARSIFEYMKDRAAAQYYGESREAESESLGQGWRLLGIDQANDEQLLNMLNGLGPNGIELAGRTLNKKGECRVGYDLTLSAPKDFSLVAEFGDNDLQKKMRDIEKKAVSATAAYIEESGVVELRSGKAGINRESASNLLFQACYHNTNRSEDPQRHTHLILFGMSKTKAGKWQRVEAKGLYAAKKEIGAVYRAELAKGLVEAGFAVERDKESFKIVGVDSEIRKQFSKGLEKIKELLGDGNHSSKAKDKAALKVRSEKKHSSREDLEKSWDNQLLKFNTDRSYLVDSVNALGRNSEQKWAEYSEKLVADKLSATAIFSDKDLRREVAQSMAAGAGGAEDIKKAIEAMRKSKLIVKLKTEDGKALYTTAENRKNEIDSLKIVASRQGKAKPISDEALKAGLEEAERIKGFKYNSEQINAVKTLTQAASKDKFLQGVAGAGKSTLALAVRLAYEKEGRKVYGAALAGKAAAGLGDGTGIETSTIDSLLLKDEHKPLDSGSLLLIDEASMIDTAKFLQLMKLANKRNIDVAFIGDSKQLQAIGAGSIFAHLFEKSARRDKAEILEATRQKGTHAKDFKAALNDMRSGNSKTVFEFLEKHKNLKNAGEGEEIQQTMSIWRKNRDGGIADKDNILVTNTNAAKKKLNDAARIINGQASRKDNVVVRTTNRDGESTGIRTFAPGDRVMTLKNAKLGGVNLAGVDNEKRIRADKTQNGAVWTIDSISESRANQGQIIKMTNDRGQSIKFNSLEYNNLDHAYAFTVHQSQGISAKAVTNLASSAAMIDKHSAYVMLSRSELAEKTAFVLPSSMIDEYDDALDANADKNRSVADRMQSLINRTQQERIDSLSISMHADESDINKAESQDMNYINRAFSDNHQHESAHIKQDQSEKQIQSQNETDYKRTIDDLLSESDNYYQTLADQQTNQVESHRIRSR